MHQVAEGGCCQSTTIRSVAGRPGRQGRAAVSAHHQLLRLRGVQARCHQKVFSFGLPTPPAPQGERAADGTALGAPGQPTLVGEVPMA